MLFLMKNVVPVNSLIYLTLLQTPLLVLANLPLTHSDNLKLWPKLPLLPIASFTLCIPLELCWDIEMSQF